MALTVYHTTSKGNGKLIAQQGWEVDNSGTNIYGRGVYFWGQMDDAHAYGLAVYGKDNYDIVSENIPVTSTNSVTYDHAKASGSHIDSIAQGLIARGVDVVVITNPHIASSTLSRAKGKAYLWLVDMRQDKRVVKY
jgi:hypothetical protein